MFKNARAFRFAKPVGLPADYLEEKLEEGRFQPCGPQDSYRLGWVAPIHGTGPLVHEAAGRMLICLCREEKILPNQVVNEAVAEQVERIEVEQSRKVGRKEKNELKDQITLELLPKAFTRKRHTFAFIDVQKGWLVIDAAGANQAEELASFLRNTLGSLPIRPPAVQQSPAFIMTALLKGEVWPTAALSVGTECDLKDTSESSGAAKLRGLDLQGEEVLAHLENGMQVERLALDWNDAMSFTVDEDLTIRRIRFSDRLKDQLDDMDSDDPLAKFDANFVLEAAEILRLLDELLAVFGGEDRDAITGPETHSEPEQFELKPAQRSGSKVIPNGSASEFGQSDPLYQPAVEFVTETRRATISGVQRKFKIGYNRAFELVEAMEQEGVVSAPGHNGAREVLAQPA